MTEFKPSRELEAALFANAVYHSKNEVFTPPPGWELVAKSYAGPFVFPLPPEIPPTAPGDRKMELEDQGAAESISSPTGRTNRSAAGRYPRGRRFR
jgi:hypothetical protein